MKTALITGANRGIGLAFVKSLMVQNFEIYACARHVLQATTLANLKQGYPNLHLLPLDVCCDQSIKQLKEMLDDKPIDYLINNAGISGEKGVTIGNIHQDNFLKVFATNCYGPVKLSEMLLENVANSHDKQVIVISSRMGSIASNERGRSYAYRASKAAVNAAMRSFAIDVAVRGIKVRLLHPGWVRTDMGGKDAPLSPKQSVDAMLGQIQGSDIGSHAETLIAYDGRQIPW